MARGARFANTRLSGAKRNVTSGTLRETHFRDSQDLRTTECIPIFILDAIKVCPRKSNYLGRIQFQSRGNTINITEKYNVSLLTEKTFHSRYRRIVYGNNEIVVPLQSICVLLLLEVLNPFYIFQVFTLSVWFAEGYFYYTIAIIIMSLFGITSTIVQTRKVRSVCKKTKQKILTNKNRILNNRVG